MGKVEGNSFKVPETMVTFLVQLDEAYSALWSAVDDARSLEQDGEFDFFDVDELDDVFCDLQRLKNIVDRATQKKKKKKSSKAKVA